MVVEKSSRVSNFIGKIPIKKLIEIFIKEIDLFVCNDTGLMHSANYCNVPIIAVFGPTNDTLTGPQTFKNCFTDVIKLSLDCQPCSIRGAGNFNVVCDFRIDCLRGISCQTVYNHINLFLT